MTMQKIPLGSQEILSLSREELGGYILEHLNSRAASQYDGEDNFSEHQHNFMQLVEQAYRSRDVTDKFASAWRWLIQRDYLTENSASFTPGWYRLTSAGRGVKTHDQIVVPRVPREVNPGPPPDFSGLTTDGHLRKQLHVLWEEAVLTYDGGAYLACVVMLGSLLEGALLGRTMEDLNAVSALKSTPRERGKVRDLKDWKLVNFLAVAEEGGWIHATRIDFSDTLRDYRNLVHPLKAKDVGYHVDKDSAAICWQVAISTLRDLGVRIGK